MAEMTYADVAAMQNNSGMNGMWNNPFMYLIWIWAFGRGGNGLFGDNAASQGALTRAELSEGFQFNDLTRSIANLKDAQAQCCCETQKSILQNGYDTRLFLDGNFNNTNNAITESRFAAQNCCCETNRNIDSVKAENYQNTCAITNAIHAEGEATRSLINSNTMQELRDRLADRDRELLTSNLFSAQQTQTQNLIEAIRPCAKPAYLTCSPYTAMGSQPCCGI